MKQIFNIFVLLFFLSLPVLGQVEKKYYPAKNALDGIKSLKGIDFEHESVNMPSFDLERLKKEDKEMEGVDVPYRFGKGFEVSYTLNDGHWISCENGNIWYMSFKSKGALFLNFVFEDFHLSEQSSLYIVNQDNSVLYGPVKNEAIPQNGFFLTDIIPGECATIILYTPFEQKKENSLRIKKVVHGYRGAFSSIPNRQVGDSESCNNDIVCFPEYENESNAVALVLLETGTEWCSGSLLMSTDLSFKPYFLTAFHCIDSSHNNQLSTSEKEAAQKWLFVFQFKKTICNGSSYSNGISYNGDYFRAASYQTDFALVELKENVSSNTSLTWLGWDKSGQNPTSGVGIHHPHGDLMKISFEYNAFSSYSNNGGNNNFWLLNYDDGVVEHNSSGSPVLNENNRVVGQLYGNSNYSENLSYCSQPRAEYGKFHLSWTGGGSNDNRLSNWLDPIGTGQTSTNTSHPISFEGIHLIPSSQVYSVENLPSGYTIDWNLSDNYYNQNCLQQNYPTQNKCMITRSNSQNMMNGTLTATIKYNSTTIKTLTKTGLYAYSDFYGQYTSDNLSGTIDYTHIFYVKPGYNTTITSPNLIGATVSYSNSGTTPSYFSLDPTLWKLYFTMPTNNNGIPVIINVTDLCGNQFQLYAIPQSSYYLNISYEGSNINISLNENGNALRNPSIEQPWSYEIRSATRGDIKASGKVYSSYTTISTAGWPKGIYIVKATIGKEDTTEKIIVR